MPIFELMKVMEAFVQAVAAAKRHRSMFLRVVIRMFVFRLASAFGLFQQVSVEHRQMHE